MQEPQKPEKSVHEFLQLLITQEANFAPLAAHLTGYDLEIVSLGDAQAIEVILLLGIQKTLEEKFIKHKNYDGSQLSKAITDFYRSTTDYANRRQRLGFLSSKAATVFSDWMTGESQRRPENLKKATKEIEQLVEQFSSRQQTHPTL